MKKIIVFTSLLLISSLSQAQNIQDIRWKSESQVRAILGNPQSVSQPVGTHATYTMWRYADFTVAFSNNTIKRFTCFVTTVYESFSYKKIVNLGAVRFKYISLLFRPWLASVDYSLAEKSANYFVIRKKK